MSLKNLPPNASNLYKHRDRIAKAVLDKTLAEARTLANWAGERIPNGPAAGAFMHGYNIGAADLDLAVAMIVARVRAEAVADFITRNSVLHDLHIRPGVYVHGTLRADEYATGPKMAREARHSEVRRTKAQQLAVRKSGKCENCGCEFIEDLSAQMSGPPKRTRAQWRAAIKAVAAERPREEKIPNHKRSPTGKRPKPSKRKSK